MKLHLIGIATLAVVLFVSVQLNAQSYNHWTRSFNEESSLLAGAVVGGGSGPSAIYYNPSSISEITESKLSVHASLFSFRFYNIQNALGDGIDLKRTNIQAEPRFLSYMIKPKKHPGWSLEFAMLNNENYKLDMARSVDMENDVLTNTPGPDRYYATFQYLNRYRDDWIGVGWSFKVNPHLFLGVSMFVTIKSMEYSYHLDIEAYPLDSIPNGNTDFTTANSQQMEYAKYNDYRLLWKFGILYKRERFSIGACYTTRSVGGIYSDGKRVSRRYSQSGITDPESGEAIPDFFIGDFREKKEVNVDHKTPFSIAAGFTFYSKDKKKNVYTTVEYFDGYDSYKLLQADEGSNIASGNVASSIEMNEWLTFISGARPVFNAAIGHTWEISDQLQMLIGFRTDFNYLKNLDMEGFDNRKAVKTISVDNYHFSGGVAWSFLGQDLITGFQYTLGLEKDQTQVVNLSDPVEYNQVEHAALVGNRQDNMSSMINSLSIYIGATFNFGGEK